MNTLFKPAAAVLGRFRFSTKFMIIFAVILLPLVGLNAIIVSTFNDKIRTLEHEVTGLTFIQAIRPLLVDLPQHRGMTNAFLLGDTSFKSKIASKQNDIDQALAHLNKLSHELNNSLETDEYVTNLNNQWSNIKTISSTLSAERSFELHSSTVSYLQELLAHVADTSEMTLSADEISIHLTSALITRLPVVIEAMGQARGIGSGVAAIGSSTEEQKIKLAVLSDRIKLNNHFLQKELHSVLEHDSELNQSMGQIIDQNQEGIYNFTQLIKSELQAKRSPTISAEQVFTSGTMAINSAFNLFDKIIPILDKHYTQKLDEALFTETIAIGSAVAILLIVAYIFATLYFSINSAVHAIKIGAQQISSGHLYTRIDLHTSDELEEIAREVNVMADKTEEMIKAIVTSANQLAAATEQLAATSDEESRNIDQQNNETDLVATAMNQMNATVHEVARNAANAAEAATKASSEAEGGLKIVHGATNTIERLATDVDNAANVIQSLEHKSNNIGSILDVIKEIADQTNLLALNAAIEAARAGEHGRGFAVVADEVRTLASRTQESTTEIEIMIQELQAGAQNAVETMSSGREVAVDSVSEARQAATALEAISLAIGTINEMNAMIASAAEQQSSTTEEMNKNITNIHVLSEHNATAAAQTTSSSRELSELATDLKQLVSLFRLTA